MNKQMMMVLTVAIALSAGNVFAAVRGMEAVRSEATEATKHALDHGAITALRGVPDAQVMDKASVEVSRIGGADAVELKSALGHVAKVKQADGSVKSVSVADLSKTVMKMDQMIRETNRNDLSADGQAHLDALDKATKASAKFLSLANRTSAQRPGGNADGQAAFDRQLSLINTLAKMDTTDLAGHTAIMEKAYAARTSPNMDGDVAFMNALKDGKTDQQLKDKIAELLNCVE
jgi:hypothetical protein